METVSGAPVSDIDIDGPASLEHVGTCHLLFSATDPRLKHQDKDSVWLQSYTHRSSVNLLLFHWLLSVSYTTSAVFLFLELVLHV